MATKFEPHGNLFLLTQKQWGQKKPFILQIKQTFPNDLMNSQWAI